MDDSASSAILETDRDTELMQATYRALCKHGYDNLTLSNIADEFDKSQSLINYRYGTKDQLVLTLLNHLVYSSRNMFGEIEEATPTARLETFIDRFLFGPTEETDDFRDFITALNEFSARSSHNEVYREHINEFHWLGVESLIRIIEDGIEDGSFNEVDPELTATLIHGAMTAAHNERISLGHEEAPERIRKAIEQLILANLYR